MSAEAVQRKSLSYGNSEGAQQRSTPMEIRPHCLAHWPRIALATNATASGKSLWEEMLAAAAASGVRQDVGGLVRWGRWNSPSHYRSQTEHGEDEGEQSSG